MQPLILLRSRSSATLGIVVAIIIIMTTTTILHSFLATTTTTTMKPTLRQTSSPSSRIFVSAWLSSSPITSRRSSCWTTMFQRQRATQTATTTSRNPRTQEPARVRRSLSLPFVDRRIPTATTTTALRLSSSSSSSSSSSTTRTTTATTSISSSGRDGNDENDSNACLVVGRVWLEGHVVQALNELYDPHDVARRRAQQQWKKFVSSQPKKKSSSSSSNATDPTTGNMEPNEAVAAQEEALFVQQAMASSSQSFTVTDAAVTTATKAEFGDYQINAALSLASALQQNPRTVAQELLHRLQCLLGLSATASSTATAVSAEGQQQEQLVLEEEKDAWVTLELAGPGFINVAWTDAYLCRAVRAMARDPSRRLGVPRTARAKKIVVDFSSPNIAKEMHVGHLRSTILGDTLCNVLEFVGHETVRLNHVGDWGTQFGMLVEHLRDACPDALEPSSSSDNNNEIDLGDLVQLYKAAKKRFDADADFQTRARQTVVALQAGEPSAVAAWETLCQASRVEYQQIYDRLNIRNLHERGESFYNPFLHQVIADLEEQNLAVESDGATVVFLDGYTNRDGSPLPMLVRKSDGGFNYATTDLAAVRHRCEFENGERADRVLYVTDAGQSMHFAMVFEAARKAGFVPPTTSLEHVPFGLVQGADGKKFATRSGDTVKLKDLLDEAVRIAGQDLRDRYRDSENDTEFLTRVDRVASIVGIGAVKYADLSMNRESNYRFSYERMLSLNGNTAPYMLYAYARICGIVRKAVGVPSNSDSAIEWPVAADEIIVSHDSERELMRSLVKLPDVIREVELDLYPNRLCDYLFETSQKFNQFYENCSVMNAETPALKASRLSLCTATAGTLRLLLTLLGIQVVEKL